MENTLKVYVADRSPAVLERLTDMLAQIPEVKVVGQASNLGGVLDTLAQLYPEVVIIDAHLPGGIEVLKTIKREKPATVVVMLTDLDYPQYRDRFHSAGANKVLDISNEFPQLEKLLVKLAGEHRRDGHSTPSPRSRHLSPVAVPHLMVYSAVSEKQAESSGPPRGRSVLENGMASRLFLGNLPRSTTDAALGDFVSEAGFQVTSAVVIRDRMTGESRGFGFVELMKDVDLERAIAGLNGKPLDGRKLTVNEARPPQQGFGQSQGGGHQRGRHERECPY